LAAVINLINERRAEHIITIEDPIEFLHPHKKATLHQRELHSDTGPVSMLSTGSPAGVDEFLGLVSAQPFGRLLEQQRGKLHGLNAHAVTLANPGGDGLQAFERARRQRDETTLGPVWVCGAPAACRYAESGVDIRQ
jgi:hypothetical protein